MDDNENGLIIKCSVCGNIPSVPSRMCGKCGGAIKIHCSQCGHLSEWGRHYCEKCGNPLPRTPDIPQKPAAQPKDSPAAQKPAKKIKLEIQSLQDAAQEHEHSFRMKIEELSAQNRLNSETEEGNPAEKTVPQPKKRETAAKTFKYSPPPSPNPYKNRKNEKEEEIKKTVSLKETEQEHDEDSSKKEPVKNAQPAQDAQEKPASKKTTLYAIIISAVLLLGFSVYYFFIRPYMPKLQLTMAAKNYLTAFTQGNFEKAYSMLSTNSKTLCPLEDYINYSKSNFSKRMEFRNIEVHSMKGDQALVKYQILDNDGNWVNDYTSFIKEQDKWTRPYTRTLYPLIFDAMERKDYTQALFYAQRLYITDPADPKSLAYSCFAEYASGLYELASDHCDDALQKIEGYPVKLTTEEINTVMMNLADSYVKQNRIRNAMDAFDRLDERANLSAEQHCSYLLNRTEVCINLKDIDKAKTDLQLATGICPNDSADRIKAFSLLNQITGKAGPDAIMFAKKSKIKENLPEVEVLRQRSLQEEIKKLGKKAKRKSIKDNWKARHLGGCLYRVTIIREYEDEDSSDKKEIFSVSVDLLQKKGDIEHSLLLPEGRK